jgi:signal transduction histidine kinase
MRQHEQADGAGMDYLSQHRSDEAVTTPQRQTHAAEPRVASPLNLSLAERINAACRATRALALLPPSPLAQGGADEHGAAVDEDSQMLAALRVLRDLALSDASAAFVAMGETTWRLIAQTGESLTIESRLGDALELRHGDPLVVSRSRQARIWQALEAWRTAVEVAKTIERVVLLPLFTEGRLCAFFALGFAESASRGESWLPAAGAVVTACAAGIEINRMRQRVSAESQARDAYISLAAHELRSPITSIKGYAQLLMRQARKSAVPLPEAMVRSVGAVEQQSTRMAEMIGELLDASRIRRGALEITPRAADLVAIVRGAVERRSPHHPQQTFTFEPAVPTLAGVWDVGRVEQVMRDLLDNAARHSPDGGRIVTALKQEGDQAIVTVRDEGIGIAEEDQAHVFDYLYRSPTSIERNLAGLGLGLFVSRHIAERHGGRLELSSSRVEAPAGSEFRLTLPVEAAATAA